MRNLTEEKFNIFYNFILNILNSKLNKPLKFTQHHQYYLFMFEVHQLKKYYFHNDDLQKIISISFEFSKHYSELYYRLYYCIKFCKYENSDRLCFYFNKSMSKNKNDTRFNFNLNNINTIINKINMKLKKTDHVEYLSNTIDALIDYDVEELINYFEKELILHSD